MPRLTVHKILIQCVYEVGIEEKNYKRVEIASELAPNLVKKKLAGWVAINFMSSLGRDLDGHPILLGPKSERTGCHLGPGAGWPPWA
jgi:hypothetical protein